MTYTDNIVNEEKRVKITSKRQFTIPQKFYKELGFNKEAVCIMGDGMLILYPAPDAADSEFAEDILTDLIAEGFSGNDLLIEFKNRKKKIRPAVAEILKKAREAAKGKGEYSTYDEIFESEE